MREYTLEYLIAVEHHTQSGPAGGVVAEFFGLQQSLEVSAASREAL